jgi:hypothetical protein
VTPIRRARNSGADFTPREAFDVVAAPTERHPVTRLGYLTFRVMKFRPGWVSYYEGFQSRAAMMWSRNSRRAFP